MVIKRAARVTAGGWQTSLEVSRSQKVCLWLPITQRVTDGLHTAQERVVLLIRALKPHLTPKADG